DVDRIESTFKKMNNLSAWCLGSMCALGASVGTLILSDGVDGMIPAVIGGVATLFTTLLYSNVDVTNQQKAEIAFERHAPHHEKLMILGSTQKTLPLRDGIFFVLVDDPD